MIDDGAPRGRAGDSAPPREQLLVREDDDELSMALFLDAAALANLERHDPAAAWTTTTSPTSAWRSRASATSSTSRAAPPPSRCVSPLELELQAEVDKFVSCLLLAGRPLEQLRARLYGDVAYADDLDDDERDRYRTANDEARRYAGVLERRFVERRADGRDAGGAAPLLPDGPGSQARAHRAPRLIAINCGT